MANNNLVCPICGQPTRVYMGNARKDRLCGKHADELKAGNILLGDDGIFRDAKSKQPLKQGAEGKEQPKSTADNSELTCIICGEPSNGKHFCVKCYNKYKDRSIDIRISNCRDTQVIDEYGNKTKKTKDGRSVRSLSEKIIIDYFFDIISELYMKKQYLTSTKKVKMQHCTPTSIYPITTFISNSMV